MTHGFALGTNDIGQDILSRMIWGTRIALIIGFSSALISLFIGVPLGLIAGFAGGGFDRVLSLIMDSLYSFPGLILAIAIAAVLGPSILNIIVAISVLYIPTYYRIVRGQTLTVKEEVYIEAAKSIGAKKSEILWRYIFPNVIPFRGDRHFGKRGRCHFNRRRPFLPRSWPAANHRGLGHRSRPRTALHPDSLVDDHLPRHGHHAGGVVVHFAG